MTYHSAPGILKMVDRTDDEVLSMVGKHFNVSIEEMKSPSRTRDIVSARQISMFFLYVCAGKTCTYVAKLFNRDHTTVLRSMTQVKNLMQTEPDFLTMVNKLNGLVYAKYIPPPQEKIIKKMAIKRMGGRPRPVYTNIDSKGYGVARELHQNS